MCENDTYVRLDAYAPVQTHSITMESAPELKHTSGMRGGGQGVSYKVTARAPTSGKQFHLLERIDN